MRGVKSKENPKEEPKAPQAGQTVGCSRSWAGPTAWRRYDRPPGMGLLHRLTHPFLPCSPNA